MELRLIFMALVCLCIAQVAFAVEENYPFRAEKQQHSFVRLTKQIRCVACNNQTVYDSNSNVAQEMRQQIYSMLNADISESTILKRLRDKYGDYIFFMPPWNKGTFALWFTPIISLFVVLFSLWRWGVYKTKWQ